MGKINQGILGGFSGKVGNVIGGTWKGIDYMRVKPANVANPKTEGQMGQRSKFTTVLQFLQPMRDHIKIGFKDYANKQTAFNSAMSYNLNHSVIGDFPLFTIDYSSALVTRGNLAGVQNLNASSDLVGQLQLTWNANSSESNANSTDLAFVLVYDSVNGTAYSIKTDSTRDSINAFITVPTNFSGINAEVFFSFITPDGKAISNSKYAGSVFILD